MGHLVAPKIIKLDDLRKMIGYLLLGDKRPKYVQVRRFPMEVVFEYVQIEKFSFEKLNKAVGNGLIKASWGEKMSIEEFYNNLNDNWILTNRRPVEINKMNISKYIERQDIKKLFSYAEYIKNGRIFDDRIFNSYLKAYKLTAYEIIFLDCEFYLTTEGSELGRISIVDSNGDIIFDEYVKSKNRITNYQTRWSGLTKNKIKSGLSYEMAMKFLLENVIGKNTIIAGHSLENDLKKMKLYHENIIDTAYLYMGTDGYRINLGILCKKYLNISIQQGQHDSVEDARGVLGLVRNKIEEIDNFINPCACICDDFGMCKGILRKYDDFSRGFKIFLFRENNEQFVAYKLKN